MLKIILYFFVLFFFSTSHSETEKDYINSYYYTKVLNKKPTYIFSSDSEKGYTPYYVDYDFKKDNCTIYYTKEKDKLDKKLLKFAIYHEASHCVLYQEATIYKEMPKLFYLLLTDSLNYQQDKKIGYLYFHELYADSLAAAMLLKETGDKELIKDIINMRLESPFGGHQTEDLLENILTINWSRLNIIQIKAKVLKMTENYFLDVWVKKYFNDEYSKNTFPIISLSLIKTFYNSQHYHISEEEKDFYKTRMSGFSSSMKNKHFKLLEVMYKYKDEPNEKTYLQKVCSQGSWCR